MTLVSAGKSENLESNTLGKPGPTPEVTAKRRQNMAKARQQRRDNFKEKQAAKAEGRLPNIPNLPVGQKRWNIDEVITHCLEANDALESRRIVQALIQKAAYGNDRAAQLLMERSLGKPLQKVQVSGGLSIETLDQALPGVPDGDLIG
jgi:hypothetical protein